VAKAHLLALSTALWLGGPAAASAHGGGLIRYGCHHSRKAGGYHCHRGSLAGQALASKADMLRQLQGRDAMKPMTERSRPK
jgi:hypothetical protein